MNSWSRPEYAVAVREALEGWMVSTRTYVDSFGGTVLGDIGYAFYLSNVNSTGGYDVLVTFVSSGMPPGSGTVGLTAYKWDPGTREPSDPITINVTTYSKSASALFVRNVVMHEFGHALGLGHASSSETANGPELMYERPAEDQVIYPSTLDVYGLTLLYQGNFSQKIQLPSSIPYRMMEDGVEPSPLSRLFWEAYEKYLLISALLVFVLVLVFALSRAVKKRRPEEASQEGVHVPGLRDISL